MQKHYLERNNAVLKRQADRFERLGQNERSKRLAENQTVLKFVPLWGSDWGAVVVVGNLFSKERGKNIPGK
mgnify:CR=1 FL=1